MARITLCATSLVTAAQSLIEEARSLIELHRQELGHSRPEVMARLNAAIDALVELVDALERC
jgi:hypothetical protein